MKLTGGEVVVEYLIKENVPYAIGIPGHGCLGLVDALMKAKDRISVIQVRQEMSAVHMADGYYRTSGKPLAVFTSIGPGAINTAIGLATAYVDSTAVLALTGDTHVHMFGRGVLQEIERTHSANFPRVLEPIVKRYWQAVSVEQLPHIMQRAFSQMLCGRRGPVLIDLPMDVQADSADVKVPRPETRKCTARVKPDPISIEQAAQLLVSATRPVILAGGGVIAAEAWEELRVLAEYIGAAVVTTMMGKSSFPEDHPLYGWHAGSKGTTVGNTLCSRADVLLAVGCRFADETASSYRQGVSFAIPPTKLIHADIDAAEIGKNYPVEVGIIGDAKRVLEDLLNAVIRAYPKRGRKKSEYYREIQALRRKWLAAVGKLQNAKRTPPTISRALKELREELPEEAIVACSSGNSQAQVLQEFPFTKPKTFLTTGGFSTMGWAFPAAMGAKLAKPDVPVVAAIGDGDFMMTMQEMATAVQYNIPVVVFLLNNSGWISIKDLQMAVYGADRAYACDFERGGKLYTPDFKKAAEAFGCHAERATKAEQIRLALRRALSSGRPAVIEVIANRRYPHSGSPAVGWWDVPVPTYLKARRKEYEKARSEEVLQ
ncbi:MAG: thiamine pyrophosphate-binding protein [Candidatus Hydrogenedentota bacterium]|nr:MAG: thiamine pyrophosphate-binding protein [Candidatus Hydrogenedentota bacterium]